MSSCYQSTILPHQLRQQRVHTVADGLAAIEIEYQAKAQYSPAVKRLLSTLRTTCKHLTEMLALPLEGIYLNDLMEVDQRLIVYIEDDLKMAHQSAIQYTCNVHKLLDLSHELLGWTSDAYEIRKSWVPIREALKGKARGCIRIIEFAIRQGRTPGTFDQDVMNAWEQLMYGSKRSLLTVGVEERHFRTRLRPLQYLFTNFNLASKNPPKYRLKLNNLPESLRNEILEVIEWKTADEDLDDRNAEWLIRPVTGKNLLRYFIELYSYAVRILGIGDILCLHELLSERIVCGFIDFLRGRCEPESIISKLRGMRFLTQTYPALKNSDYRWFSKALDRLSRERDGQVQARKLKSLPAYPEVAVIAPQLLALLEEPDLTEIEKGFLIHDALVFMINLQKGHRSRNTCQAHVHPRLQRNLFETEISSELRSQFAEFPNWAKESRDKDPNTRFLVGHWLEPETKAGHEVWEIFDPHIGPILKTYLERYRPLLLSKHNPQSTHLFFTRNREPLTQKSLLNLVSRISVRITGKRMRVKDFRDIVAAQMLSDGATVEEVATRLWQLDPYSTTARYYIGGLNTSEAVAALEDELSTLLR